MKNLNPQFKPFFLTSKEACNGDLEKKIRIECFDWDRFSEDDLIGVLDVSFADLLKGGKTKKFPLINNSLKKKRNVKIFHFFDELIFSVPSIKIQEN